MNEIELLKEMRSEVPERLDVSEAGRKLAARTGKAEPGPTKRTAKRMAGAPRPVARQRMRWGLTAAGACVLAVAAVAVIRPLADPRPRPAPSAAAQPTGTDGRPTGTDTQPTGTGGRAAAGVAVVLERAALVAARSNATEIRPDQWFYLKESQHMGGDLPTFEIWDRMDGRKAAIREAGGEVKVTPPEKGPTNSGRTQREIAELPSDPDALLERMRGLKRFPLSICQPTCAPDIEDDVNTFGAIGWYMKFGPMIPPDTISAMYRALAKIPHVSIERDATDADGRKGIGVVFDADGVKAYYVLDAKDYHYMGTKVVGRDGETVGMSVLGAGIVDNPGDTP